MSARIAFLSTLLALDALDRGPQRVREYAPVPEADDAEQTPESFNRQTRRDRTWREELPEECTYETRSAEQIFEDESGYHGDRR